MLCPSNIWFAWFRHAAACVFLLLSMAPFGIGHVTAEESSARLFAAHALQLRGAGVAGDDSAGAVVAGMPGAGMTEVSALLPDLFRPFFANAVVQLGRLRSPAPVALYYNPLLDVAILTLWREQAEGYRVATARALPGERLANRQAEVELLPAWITAAVDPVEALSRITAARLDAFRRQHPGSSGQAGDDAVSFAQAAADLRAVLPRLVWNAEQGGRWTDESQAWLGRALTSIEAALAAQDVEALTAAASETDVETATVLARLPAGFAAGLALDMVLAVGEQGRLLIGSLPEDGDVYVLVLCQLEGSHCELRRFMLMSLADSIS